MPAWSGEGEVIPDSHCPLCKEPLEYNGNYWCSNPECEYVMGDLHYGSGAPLDEVMADRRAFNEAYPLLMAQRGEKHNPDSLYPVVKY